MLVIYLKNLIPPCVVNSPAADVVQEGELGVHEAGEESDLSVRRKSGLQHEQGVLKIYYVIFRNI